MTCLDAYKLQEIRVNIGYIGLGNMGRALAKRLLSHHSLVVYDSNPAASEHLQALGANVASNGSELGVHCDIVFLCLPTSTHVRSALFGAHGVLANAKRGLIIVDQTSGDPMATKAMAKELKELGIEFVDAPVSGGPPAADAGTIAIMVGAAQQQYTHLLPVLQSISPNVFHAGDVGAGHVAKLVNNLVSAAQRLVTMEAMALAVKNGVQAEKIVDIMTAGAARNFYLEKLVKPFVLSGNLSSGFTLGLLHKDIRQACQLGMESNVTMLFGNLTREFLQMAINEKGSDAQVYASALVMDRIAGTHVVPVGHSQV